MQAQDISVADIVALFSVHGRRTSGDQKTVYNASAGNDSDGLHITVDNEHVTTASSNSGRDTIGKLNLFSMVKFAVAEVRALPLTLASVDI
jgi:hypothetical protein